jgi:hypothetical protein
MAISWFLFSFAVPSFRFLTSLNLLRPCHLHLVTISEVIQYLSMLVFSCLRADFAIRSFDRLIKVRCWFSYQISHSLVHCLRFGNTFVATSWLIDLGRCIGFHFASGML